MPHDEVRSLRDWLDNTANDCSRHLRGREAQIALDALARGSSLDVDLSELHGRSVLIATRDQLTAALALVELDGVARRLTLMPPDVPREYLGAVIADAGIDVVVGDDEHHDDLGIAPRVLCRPQLRPVAHARLDRLPTEWVLFTSGTTGRPKMVVHSLAGLTGAIKGGDRASGVVAVWGTFYDIRRYGGLQIFLRALHDGGSLVLADAQEPVGDFLARLGRHGVTHMSGTPSHWRRALMSPCAHALSPRYVRLSGEIADQAILDNLAAFYPTARIGHAYASTEAGVGFDVNDGREGFPVSLIGAPGDVQMKVVDGSLRISSPRTAACYLGSNTALADPDGYVDTGDMLERIGDRYHFAGRKGGIINVGGLKVHPEEVEAVINRHPRVRMSLVHPRKSPITGAIVVAQVVLRDEPNPDGAEALVGTLRGEILDLCRQRLAQHKVPAMIRFVTALSVAASGKLERHHA